MAEYAYCRVSTKDQNLERQLLAMKIRNIPEKNIFCEKESGKDFEREVYKKLKKRLRYGDNLTVMSLDRFGRNYDQILKEWRDLTEAGVGIVVVDMPLLNTARDYDLTGRLIADIVLQLLAYVAQTEREKILDRQRQGIDAAKMRGVRFGRPPQPLPENWDAVLDRLRRGEIFKTEAAQLLGIPRTSFHYLLRREGWTAEDDRAVREKVTAELSKNLNGRGRRQPPLPENWDAVLDQLRRGEVFKKEAAQLLGMSAETFRKRLIKEGWTEEDDRAVREKLLTLTMEALQAAREKRRKKKEGE